MPSTISKNIFPILVGGLVVVVVVAFNLYYAISILHQQQVCWMDEPVTGGYKLVFLEDSIGIASFRPKLNHVPLDHGMVFFPPNPQRVAHVTRIVRSTWYCLGPGDYVASKGYGAGRRRG